MIIFIAIIYYLLYNISKKVGNSYKEGVMIIELRKKSQITLPKEIVKELNLIEGDKLEVSIVNGTITLEPVAVYPKQYLIKLEEEISVLKEDSNIKHKAFDHIDDLMKSLKDNGK